MSTRILSGSMHLITRDLKKVLVLNEELLGLWNGLTPLARNEWICWLTLVKKKETRVDHLRRLREQISSGKRRPCCWPGCPHRRPSAQKWFSKE